MSVLSSAPQSVAAHPEHIERAVRWLVSNGTGSLGHPIVPALRAKFDLTAVEACAVLREFGLAMTAAH